MPLDRRGGSELFYVDANGRRRDAKFHEQILGQGDHGPGLEVSTKIREGMLLKARRYLPAEPVNKPKEPPKAKDSWNPDQPREPAGSSEGGQFASITGGGISGGATGGPAKPLFTASSSKTHHEQRVQQYLKEPVKRNDNYRYIVGKLVEEAKGHGADHGTIAGLRTKIGESFYKQGLLKKEKGAWDQAKSMFSKGKSYGYQPTPQEFEVENKPSPDPMAAAVASLKNAPATLAAEKAHVEETTAALMEPSKPSSTFGTIPVYGPAWTKVGGQKGSVGGGTYTDLVGHEWYVKTPKTEAHVNADLLANNLYKLAGVSVSDEVKTTLEGKHAIASKIISNVKTLAQASDLQKQAAHEALRESFAVDAWLGNRDVVGEGFDNVVVQGFKAYRIDQGGALMYRAQGETKPFGVAAEEISSMRSASINSQTASVFGSMTDSEVSASIDKVTAISNGAIVKLVKDHGFGPELAETLIARKNWLAEYQKTLGTHAGAPIMLAGEPGGPPAPGPVTHPPATAAELEKAKKAGPFYPAPTSEMGKVAVKYFNEKWATTAPTPAQLEEKVADYKNAKAAVEAVQAEEAKAETAKVSAAVAELQAKAKAEKAAEKAKEVAESAKYQAEIAKIAADIGLNHEDATQVDTMIEMASSSGFSKEKLIAQFKTYYETGLGKYGLPVTPFEGAMISAYVGSAYRTPNEQLRKGYYSLRTHIFANALNKALAKLPGHDGVIRRGFSTDKNDQANYVVGNVVTWKAFSSCGKSGAFSGNMQCHIHPLPDINKTRCRDLGDFNESEKGGEVLIMAHTSLIVTKITGTPGGTMHVTLQEVETIK